MRKKIIIRLSGIFGVILGLNLGLLGASFHRKSWLPDYLREVLSFTALFLIVAILMLGAYLIYINFRDRLNFIKYKPDAYTFKKCDISDINKISEFAEDIFGSLASSKSETGRLFDINPSMFQVMKDKGGNIRGYYCMFRLSKEGVDAIERSDFNFKNLPRAYMRMDNVKRGTAIYIGALYGISRVDRAAILSAILTTLRNYRPKRVYARAATQDGRRLLEEYEFLPVGGRKRKIGEIYYKNDPKFVR